MLAKMVPELVALPSTHDSVLGAGGANEI